ncbi:DUF3549 family protein [Thalassotalea maritima]|uniref:DUF3549 family protein n=1 Tax=Thalassotalea maritima TaxID=3242416 RepID=UPI003526DB24
MIKQTIDTISELLQLSDANFRIYDIGRKVVKISKKEFQQVEQAMMPYPYPIQGHAMFALVFWQQQNQTPYIWFVKMPLDERGLLNQGARNHYLAIILEALGNDLTQDPSEKQEELLQANPYNFTPSQYKLATLNAVVKRDLKQVASSFYEHCQLYMAGKLGFDDWQGVAVQGICDFAARINEEANQHALVKAIPQLPIQVFAPLASALEGQTIHIDVISALLGAGDKAMTEADADNVANVLRALSMHSDNPTVVSFINKLLASDVGHDLNVLVTICGKNWPILADQDMLAKYLDVVSQSQPSDIFAAIFQDLVALPSVRPQLLQLIRSEQRSESLSNALAAMFNRTKA